MTDILISMVPRFITILNSITPLGLVVLVILAGVYVVYLMASSKKVVRTISDNHLSGLPGMESSLTEIASTLKSMDSKMSTVVDNTAATRDGVNYLKGTLTTTPVTRRKRK